jgi:hypothetical protein
MKTFVVTFRNKKTSEEFEVMYVEPSFSKVYKLAMLAIKEQYSRSFEIKSIIEQ